MKPTKIFRSLFAEEELRKNLQEAFMNLARELNEKDYRIAAFYSLDVAHIYDLLGDREKAEEYYRTTIEYLNQADFQPLWIRLECLRALGRYEDAVEAALNSPHHSKIELAELYREIGNLSIAQEIYAELASRQLCDPDVLEPFLYPQCLQHISDLWEKAEDAEKAREFNRRAREAWEKIEGNLRKNLYPIEKAWLYEGVGHMYEKAPDFKKAMDYYQRAREKYHQAYKEEYRASSETHHDDGDWDYYAQYFYTQLPETLMIRFYEYFMKYNFRRIAYRILNLENHMKKLKKQEES
jgi:tetratricopeptide (TPR) repeat protein